MKIYIPIAIGQTISDKVSKSIAMQTVPCEIITCATEGVVNSNNIKFQKVVSPGMLKAKLTGQTASRNLALTCIEQIDDEFVGIQDRDTVHLYKDNVYKALDCFEGNPQLGAVHLPWKDYMVQGHYKLQAVIYRRAALDGFLFSFDARMHGCDCAYENMVANGWGIIIMPSSKKLISEEK